MADFVTHYLFGEQVLSAFPAAVQLAAVRRPAVFNWGLMGPDPLFYQGLAFGRPLHKYGNMMHEQKTDALFFAFARAVNRMTGTRRAVAEAYFYGFLCHYALDSAIHPYVYCRQAEAMEANPSAHASAVHCQIESDIDYALYELEYHAPVTDFNPDKYFTLEPDELAVMAVLLQYILAAVYGVKADTPVLRSAFREMLTAQNFLYSRSVLAYRGLQRAETMLGKGTLLTSHMKIEPPSWDCLNLDCAPWHNLSKPHEIRTESVPALIDGAIQRVTALAGQYAAEFDAGWLLYHHFEDSFSAGKNPQN